jgi:hypothetical protein
MSNNAGTTQIVRGPFGPPTLYTEIVHPSGSLDAWWPRTKYRSISSLSSSSGSKTLYLVPPLSPSPSPSRARLPIDAQAACVRSPSVGKGAHRRCLQQSTRRIQARRLPPRLAPRWLVVLGRREGCSR